ncbi:putative DNA-dependent ATPase RAD55 KNAG_0D01870 [Huiozyma naganishii CBS 8797]|uniref:RecA family profile 1 domain-containing protein n=1 Tax=Huiozyma naganishii (strain ATCC MYA-139 / BCRC 22969 / CBS 8797 / KCTC 17520 / NBRC 10181 / NCYC 3082 / Yp74L-3) TaxID=1071383 RepID=J7RK98_HUIN7|nr:hypothetical protein KNAG_0D01870 [Kazachstania naganishii CBS 8797]CCK69938.1 hypothetical protein KNAG_0D01870 [Kazachstania naganishii CBS 8797]
MVGVLLSQLITDDKNLPLKSGIPSLDEHLNGGFARRSIYEIFGPPGIGKTLFGIQLINVNFHAGGEKVLWIDCNKASPMSCIDSGSERNVSHVFIHKISELLIFLQNLMLPDNEYPPYSLIIVDGFSQLLNNNLNVISKRREKYDPFYLHTVKCKNLVLLLSKMTKYAHINNSTILLLDDSMNTTYQQHLLSALDNSTLGIVADGSNFFVSDSAAIAQRRRNVHTLKSALVANAGMGNKDSKWEIFLKYRIGLFWDFLNKKSYMKKGSNKLYRTRVAIVYDLHGNNAERGKSPRDGETNSNGKRPRIWGNSTPVPQYNSEDHVVVPFQFPLAYGQQEQEQEQRESTPPDLQAANLQQAAPLHSPLTHPTVLTSFQNSVSSSLQLSSFTTNSSTSPTSASPTDDHHLFPSANAADDVAYDSDV